ncbi:MAG: ABC transporter permease DevC [Acidobacteriota bacterium]
MTSSLGVAWRQLSHQPAKLLAASAGVVVAVMLMLVQLGIREGAISSGVAFSHRLDADLVVVSLATETIFRSGQFPRRLLYRLPSDPAVAAISEVYMGQAQWRNPWTGIQHPISVYGLSPRRTMVDLPGFADVLELELADQFVFDALSRTSYGPVVTSVASDGPLFAEVNGRRIRVIDTVAVGVSFSVDGNLYGTPANFLRLLPSRDAGAIDLGLVRLVPGSNVEAARERLQELLGREARILSRNQLIEEEIAFLRSNAPIDFIFGMGTVVGFFIGFVVVYQILYTEVTHHLPQLATLKATGFTDGYLLKLVLWQALSLSCFGYLPGFALAVGVYQLAESQIQMPMSMTPARALGVWGATVIMCGFSAMVAVRRAWQADPAEVF